MYSFKAKQILFTLIAALLLAAPLGAFSRAEAAGMGADSLTVSVGYFGGPYYE